MRFLIFGDTEGCKQLLNFIPKNLVTGIVGAEIRNQYHNELEKISNTNSFPFLIQPSYKNQKYVKFLNKIKNLKPDIIIINSYSMILKKDLLSLPTKGVLNIHAAPLPKYRGSNPEVWAMINNEFNFGVTIHEVTEKIDDGPILDQIFFSIKFNDDRKILNKRIYIKTNDLIRKNIKSILNKSWKSKAQNDEKATYFHRRTPSDSEFNWHEKSIQIYNKIRALVYPLPSAYFIKNNKIIYYKKYLTIKEVFSRKCFYQNFIYQKKNFKIITCKKNEFNKISFLKDNKQIRHLIKVCYDIKNHTSFIFKLVDVNNNKPCYFLLRNINFKNQTGMILIISKNKDLALELFIKEFCKIEMNINYVKKISYYKLL